MPRHGNFVRVQEYDLVAVLDFLSLPSSHSLTFGSYNSTLRRNKTDKKNLHLKFKSLYVSSLRNVVSMKLILTKFCETLQICLTFYERCCFGSSSICCQSRERKNYFSCFSNTYLSVLMFRVYFSLVPGRCWA